MPVYFFDTSALVKRYHVEAGSETVNGLFDDPDAVFAVASITITEFVSAFTRKRTSLPRSGSSISTETISTKAFLSLSSTISGLSTVYSLRYF